MDSVSSPGEAAYAVQFKYSTCTACDLHTHRVTPIRGWGNDNPDIVFVLDRVDLADLPGGAMDTGPQKIVLQELLQEQGLDMSMFWITATTACPTCSTIDKPGALPREVAAPAKDPHLLACRRRLHEEILALQPALVVACGAKALKALVPGVPPKYNEAFGNIVEAYSLPADGPSHPIPILTIHSLLTLVRTPEDPDPDRIWGKTREALDRGLTAVAELLFLQENKDNT